MQRNRVRWGDAAVDRAVSEAGSAEIGRGFTLVELLIVIGIISLLTGLLLPTLSHARAQANSLTCQSNLQQMGQAIQIYVGSSKGLLPFGYWDGSFNLSTGQDLGYNANAAADWSILLQSVMSPNAGANYNANFSGGLKSALRRMFFDPDAPLGETVNSLGMTLTQYACHPRLMPKLGNEDLYAEMGSPAGVKCYLRPYNMARIRHGSDIALLFDASVAPVIGGGWSVEYPPVAVSLDHGRIASDTYLTDQYNLAITPGLNSATSLDMTPAQMGAPNADVATNPQDLRFRHMNNRYCNVLMADMHVESFALQSSGQTDLTRGNINVNP